MHRRWLVALALVVSLGSPAYAGARGKLGRSTNSASFDWDDNVVTMSTKTFLKQVNGGPELALSSAEWARARNLVGKPGELEHYYVDQDPVSGSFRDNGDHGGENRFLRDLKRSVAENPRWRGPSWKAFVKALSRSNTASHVSIITARVHAPATIYEGLEWLKAQGYIEHLPPMENLFGVGNAAFELDGKKLTGPTAERKVIVQRRLLDTMQASAHGEKRVFAFSDDDWNNYSAAVDGLSKSVRAGRWPDVEIHVLFTGHHDPSHAIESTVLNARRTAMMMQ